MNSGLVSLSLGLVASLLFGTGDFLIGKAARKVQPVSSSLLVNSYSFLAYALVAVVFFYDNLTFNRQGVLYAVIAGTLMGVAQATFFKAISLGPVGLVSAIGSTYPLVTLVTSIVLLSIGVSVVQILGIVLVVGGVMIASGLVSSSATQKQKIGKGPLLALVPAAGWGLSWVWIYRAMEVMSWQAVFMVEMLMAPPVILLLARFIKSKEEVLSLGSLAKSWRVPELLCVAVMQMSALLAINIGISKFPENTAVIVALSSAYPVLTIFLALRHLNERIPLLPLAGGVVGVIGVVVLSLG